MARNSAGQTASNAVNGVPVLRMQGKIVYDATAITTTGTRSFVTLVTTDANGKQTLTRTNVTIGLKGDSMTQILSGLSSGQEVEFGTTSSTTGSSFPTGGIPGGGLDLGGGGFGALRRAAQG